MQTIRNAYMKIAAGQPWALDVGGKMDSGKIIKAQINIQPVEPVWVKREKQEKIPLFEEQKWRSGCRLLNS